VSPPPLLHKATLTTEDIHKTVIAKQLKVTEKKSKSQNPTWVNPAFLYLHDISV